MERIAIISATVIAILASGLTSTSLGSRPRELTFDDRVKAQETIERVYYSHQIDARTPFEDAVPRSLLERRVRTYLKQSAALEQFWRIPVTASMLRTEADRIAHNTRMPARLRELQSALGEDPVLIQECLVRPVLVDRLSRRLFAADASIHSATRSAAMRLRNRVAGGRPDPEEGFFRNVVTVRRWDAHEGYAPGKEGVASITLDPAEFDKLRAAVPSHPGEAGGLEDQGDAFIFRTLLHESEARFEMAVYSIPKTTWETWWAGIEAQLEEESVTPVASAGSVPPEPSGGTGGVIETCPPDDVWSNGSLESPPFDPGPRYAHSAVWTGSHMIFWGGELNGVAMSGGARYDPTTDVWSPLSSTGAPGARVFHTAVWTGSRMIVWGGAYNSNLAPVFGDGALYDPLSDTWSAVSMVNAPAARSQHTAVWTGSRMIVWGGGGYTSGYLDDGALYDPSSNTWSALPVPGAPAARRRHSAVWTGNVMVVWGGQDSVGPLNSGGRYNPGAGTWASMTTAHVPLARYRHTAVWTGTEMVVWGGETLLDSTATGARYDPVGNKWSATSTSNAPLKRYDHSAVWTGSRMVIWGGTDGFPRYADGSSYDPVDDSWTMLTTVGAPPARAAHSAVWTGSLMVIYGGYGQSVESVWGRYDPSNDTWLPSTTPSVPAARVGHTAVWTGNVMIVWGGGYAGDVSAGWQYDPVTDAWSPTTTIGQPMKRAGHSAVWTGSVMVVNGGIQSSTTLAGPGGRYDPILDTWQPVSQGWEVFNHTAVWTGSRVLLFGGAAFDGNGYVIGRRGVAAYDPQTDTFTPLSNTGAPSARYFHAAVWTGNKMIVWGGCNTAPGNSDCEYATLGNGGVYDPAMNTWSATSQLGAPSARAYHTAVWSAGRMVIWGGSNSYAKDQIGGVYDPVSDTWSSTSASGAPAGRAGHTAVAIGDEMIVWGGRTSNGTYLATGGRYSPGLNTWQAVSTIASPSPRESHTAIWDGNGMIVWGGRDSAGNLRSGGRYLVGASLDQDGDGLSGCAGDCDDTTATVYPGAPQICDGMDNDCDHAGWPSLAQTNEWDDDGDGLSECQADCNDGDPQAWALPGPTTDLSIEADTVTLDWLPPGDPGGTSVVYDLLRSAMGNDFTAAATCVVFDEPAITGTDPTIPLPGGAFFYLTRAGNACPGGEGSLGFDSSGSPRIGRSCP